MPSITDGQMMIDTEERAALVRTLYSHFTVGDTFYWSPHYPYERETYLAARLLALPNAVSGVTIRPQWAGPEPIPLPIPA